MTNKRTSLLFALIALYLSFSLSGNDLFTDEELAYLQENPVILVGNEMDWPPFDYNRNGKPTGLSVDYMNYIAEMIGVHVEYVFGPTWDGLLQMMKKGELDMLLNIIVTEDRKSYISFTEPYARNPNVLVSLENAPITDLNNLKGKKLAVGKGYFYEEVLRRDFPEIQLHLVDNILEGLKAVTLEEADAAIGEQAVVSYFINENFLAGLRIVSADELGESYLEDLSLGVRKDNELLFSIMNKAVKAVPDDILLGIREKWLGKQPDEGSLSLTLRERDFLKDHSAIKVQSEENWPPFNYVRNGEPMGISIDYMRLLGEIIGIDIEYISGRSFDQYMSMARSGELDVVLDIARTPEREEFLSFPGSHLTNQKAIISSRDNSFDSLVMLEGKSVAVPKGFSYEKYLRDNHQGISVIPVEDVLQGLQKVAVGDVDAAVAEEAVARYMISENLLPGLYVSPGISLGDSGLDVLYLAVRKDLPELHSILVKAINQVTPAQESLIRQKHMTSSNDDTGDLSGDQLDVSDSDLSRRLIRIGFFLLFFTTIMIFAVRFFNKRLLKEGKFDILRVRITVISLLALIVIIVIVLSSLLLNRLRNRAMEEVGDNLQYVLGTTEESLSLWNRGRLRELELIGQNREFISLVEQLQEIPDEHLAGSNTLKLIRQYMIDNSTSSLWKDFSLIGPDQKIIGAFDDKCIGLQSPIALEREALLNNLFKGHGQFVPPLESECEDSATELFYAVPLFNEGRRVIAVLAWGESPAENLTRIFQKGWIGESGETYAFDENARLLSHSRFEKQIDASPLKIRMINPESGELSPMAMSALKGIDGVNLSGYSDYRGVEVFGAWLWSEEFHIGLVTEIDSSDAMSSYNLTRDILILILAVVMTLIVGITLFSLILSEKTNQSLIKLNEDLESRVESRTRELTKVNQLMDYASETARLAYWELDLLSGDLIFNDKFYRLIDTSAEAEGGYRIKGNVYLEKYVHPEDRDMVALKIRRALESDDEYSDSFEHRINTAAGKIIHAFIRYDVAGVERGDSFSCSGIFLDISDRVDAEMQIRESRNFLDSIINNTQNVVFAKDLKGRYLLVNDNWGPELNMAREEVLGRTDLEIFGEKGRAYMEVDKQIIKNREIIQVEDKTIIHGEEKAFYTTKFPIYDTRGTLFAVGGIASDMTELIHARDEAEKYSRDYANFLESTSDFVYLKDRELRYLAVSRPLSIMLGLKEREDAVGLREDEVQNTDSIIRFQEDPEKRVLAGEELEFVENILSSEEGSGWVSTIKKPLRDGKGEIVGVLSISRDINKQKETEQELRRNLEELELFNRLTVGRELKMIRLKEEVNELLSALGKPGKYEIVEDETEMK